MKGIFRQDVPPRAAAVIIALALLTSAVTGSEKAPDSSSVAFVAPTTDAAPSGPANTDSEFDPEFDPSKIARTKPEGEIQDLFSPRSMAVAVVPSTPAPTPSPAAKVEPVAPPLPFKYLGRMADAGNTTIFLERNRDTLNAIAGQMLDGTYRLESVTETAAVFVYLPLGTRQTLSFGLPN